MNSKGPTACYRRVNCLFASASLANRSHDAKCPVQLWNSRSLIRLVLHVYLRSVSRRLFGYTPGFRNNDSLFLTLIQVPEGTAVRYHPVRHGPFSSSIHPYWVTTHRFKFFSRGQHQILRHLEPEAGNNIRFTFLCTEC